VIDPNIVSLVKIGYLKWKSPKEIARGISILLQQPVRTLDVHNYIQGKHTTWKHCEVFCKRCNVEIKNHKRCIDCTRLIHGGDLCCMTILKDLQ